MSVNYNYSLEVKELNFVMIPFTINQNHNIYNLRLKSQD